MDEEVKRKVTEDMKKNKQDIEIYPGMNLIDKIDGSIQAELINKCIQIMDEYDQKMAYDSARYDYATVYDWVKELDRCYNVEMKPKEDKKTYDYKGFSNIVTNDYHDAIVKVQNRMKEVYRGVNSKFGVISDNPEYDENAQLAKVLVTRSMRMAHLESNVVPSYHDLANYGFCIAHTPLRIVDTYYDELNGFMLDKKTGKPIEFMGELLQTEESWKEVSRLSVYTDWIPVDPRDFKFDPTIKNVKHQPAVFRRMVYSKPDLEMMAEYEDLVGLDEFLDEKDCSARWGDSPTDTEENEVQPVEMKVLTECYIYHKDLVKNSGIKKYILVMGNESRLLSIKECIYKTWPFINAQFQETKAMPFCGLGVGQTIYSSWLYLNTRINQAFDSRSFDILGGGIYDGSVPIPQAVPGVWNRMPGMSSMQGDVAVSWSQLMNRQPNFDRYDLDVLKGNIQAEVPSLLGGSPTGTSADRTKAGLQMLLQTAQSMIDTSLLDIEDKLFGQYAQDAYDNYILFFKTMYDNSEDIFNTLVEWLGFETMSYMDQKEGVRKPLVFPAAFPPVQFTFTGAREALDNTEKMAKINEVLGSMVPLAQLFPKRMEQMFSNFSPEVLFKNYVKALNIGDVDTYFPDYEPAQEIVQLKDVVAQMQQELMMSKEILRKLSVEAIQNPELQDTLNNIFEKTKDQASSNQNV